MIRKLMASSALLALISAGAVSVATAQDTPTKPAVIEEPTTAAAAGDTATEKKLVPDTPTVATAFIGRSVYSSADPESDNIGDVNDLIIDEDGSITAAVVGVGGFLGIGEKNVAVPFDELEVVERDGEIRLIYAATREELDAAPAVDMAEYDPAVRFAEEQAALAITQQPGGLNAPLAPLPATGTDMAAAPAQDMTAATAEKPAAAPADEQVAATEAAPADDEAAAPADEQIAATEATPADEEEAATPAASGTVAFISPSADQVRASDLMGNDVLGPEGESIGRISDLVFQAEGGAHAALVDVGGFLGVGERTVAISFGELQLSRPEEGGDLQVAVAMTREQLEQLPAVAIAEAALPPLAGAPSDTMAATEEPLPLPAPAGAEQPADQTAATETPAAEPEEPMVAAGETPAATDELTTGSISASQDIAASSLIGARVYGPDDSSLGSIDDVVFDQGGAIDGVIVNVGGFLGIGSKPVALDFESLQVRQDEFNVVTVVVDATKDQLDQAPAYEVSMQ